MPTTPKVAAPKPQVAATGVAGIAGALAVWGFNIWASDQCGDFGECGRWVLDDPVNGLMVALIAFLAGPVLRKYQRWTQ